MPEPKPHCCKTCGETNPENFYPTQKGTCKKCHCARTSVRLGMLRDGTLIPKRHRPKVKPSRVSDPAPMREREAVLRCRCGCGIYNAPKHLIGLVQFVCRQCAEGEG